MRDLHGVNITENLRNMWTETYKEYGIYRPAPTVIVDRPEGYVRPMTFEAWSKGEKTTLPIPERKTPDVSR